MREHFLLDPTIHFLNHGSFGACPRSVMLVYRAWQRRLERQPVKFLGRELPALLAQARQALGAYLGAPAGDLVFVPNATHGVNIVARSLALQPGDEILTSDHEYGACDYTWEFIAGKNGAKIVRQSLPLPAHSAEDLLEQFWQGVTPRTKVIFLSHITSPTALQLPVQAVCACARQAGILTLIDGAHAPGQIPLDLQAVGADFYTGNCHKWMLSPKGAGFIYARPAVQGLIEPLVVSWGLHPTMEAGRGSSFLDLLEWTGTFDPAAYLSVPAAIEFMRQHDWEEARRACHALLQEAIQPICDLSELEPPYPLESDLYHQMGVAPLPAGTDGAGLKGWLYDRRRVEAPVTVWRDRLFLRISVQAYNTAADVEALVTGVADWLVGRRS